MKRFIFSLCILLTATSVHAQYNSQHILGRHHYRDKLNLGTQTIITDTWSCADSSKTCTADTSTGEAISELAAGDVILLVDGSSNWQSYTVESNPTDDDIFIREDEISSVTTDPLVAHTTSAVYIINTGMATDGTTTPIYDGAGIQSSLGIGDYLLSSTTADDYAMKLLYTTNKTSGTDDDYGLYIGWTNTASPGTSYPLYMSLEASSFYVTDVGVIGGRGIIDHTYLSFNLGVAGLDFEDDSFIRWSSTGAYSGTKDLDISRYWDGSSPWLCVSDGDASGCDGYAVADRLMVGGTSGPLMRGSGGAVQFRTNDDSTYGNVEAGLIFASGSVESVIHRTNGNVTMTVQDRSFAAADNAVDMASGTFTNSTGEAVGVMIKPTFTTSGDASSAAFVVDVLGTPAGSGANVGVKVQSDKDNAAFTALNLINYNEPTTGQTGDTSSISFSLFGTDDDAVSYAEHEAARIETYKASDWFHATTEADHDSGLKFYVTNSGVETLGMTLDNAGAVTAKALYNTSLYWLLDGNAVSLQNNFTLKWSASGNAAQASDLALFRYNDGSNTYAALGDGAGVAIGDVTRRLLVGTGTAAAPSLAIKDGLGNVNDGFYMSDNTVLSVGLSGSLYYSFSSNGFYTLNANGPKMSAVNSTTTAPTVLFDRADANTGWSGGAAGDDGQLSGISDGVEIVRIDSPGIDVTGHITATTPVMGELYATSGTITTPTSHTGFTGFTQGNITGGDYVTADVADGGGDHFIIGSSGAGDYAVNISASFTGSNSAMFTCYLYEDATTVTHIGFHRTMGANAAIGSASTEGIHTFAAADEPQMRCTADTGDITFSNVIMTIHRLN